jgi:hypothetical protein
VIAAGKIEAGSWPQVKSSPAKAGEGDRP